MNVLAKLKDLKIPIAEVPIDTVYLEGISHHIFAHCMIPSRYIRYFSIRHDKWCLFLIDLVLFMLFAKVFKIVAPMSFLIIATILARLLSSLFNYYINRHTVFKSGSRKSFTDTIYWLLSL